MRHLAAAVLLALVLLGGGVASRAEPSDAKKEVWKIQPKINTAIDKGVMRLLLLQQRDGSWAFYEKQYQGGMTALAVYTLLKSGVPASHPAVERGIARLYAWDPQETYSVACELMALEAAQDPRHHERMKMLLARLVSWQRFGWGYPYGNVGDGEWNRTYGRLDLSNTQFAAMGMRAAAHAGFASPAKAWQDLVRNARSHQARPMASIVPDEKGNPVEMAGFGYEPTSAPTGSMTCAGVAVLKICRNALGTKCRVKLAKQIDESIQLGLTWIDRHWSVEENPNAKNAHKNYYLYGLERVGSLLAMETIGTHHWYLEGARELLRIQTDDGNFGGDPETCFALLFLVRATGQSTGKPPIASVLGRYALEKQESAVRFRAEGHSPLALWVTAVGDPSSAPGTLPRVRRRLRRAEYRVDGEVVASRGSWTRHPDVARPPVHADPLPPMAVGDETFALLHHFRGPGTYEVQADVGVTEKDGIEWSCVRSLPLVVTVQMIWPPWSVREAGWTTRNLLRGPVTVSASSVNHDHQQPERTVDGLTSGFWIAAKDDPCPTLDLRLKKGVKANTIVLHPPASKEGQRGAFDSPTRIELRVNGKGPHVVVPDPDPLRPTALRLPRPVRVKRLEIRIPERLPGARWHGETGFSEISLELDPVAAPTLLRGEDGSVALACATPGAAIHFTLDGTLPTADSARYEEPFVHRDANRLHAIAVLPTGETSRLLIANLRACDGYLHLDRSRWKILKVDSEQLPGHPARLALDGNPRTFWHTRHTPTVDTPPHELVIDLGEMLIVEGFTYRTRHDGTHGNVGSWSLYVSETLDDWGPFVGQGIFENVKRTQVGTLIGPVKGRYVRFVAHSEANGGAWTTCAEFDLRARRP